MAKSKDTKLLITKLQFLVNKLDRFRNMINSIDPEICSELEFPSLEVRLDQNKSIPNEYTELSAQASSFSITLENLPSYEEFEEEYFQLIAKASLILKNKDRCNSQSPSNSLNSSETLQSNCNVKLPMLNIPTFSGHYTDWASFHETFTALIHNNSNLSDVEKFYCLQNSLRGSAKELTHDLTATAANYKIALSMLNDRFNNEKLIIFSHLESIFEHTKLTKESAFDLRKFQDNLTRHLRASDNYKLSDDKFKAAVLAYIIKSKVDVNTAASYSKFKLKQIPFVDESLSFLSSRCEILEDISLAILRITTLILDRSQITVLKIPTFLSLSLQRRLEKANELKICQNCLKHSSNYKCNSKHKCKNCHKPHNSLLCFSNSEITSVSRTSQGDEPGPSGSGEVTISSSSLSSEQTALSCTSYNEVLLSTAIIRVLTKENKWINARCLLDSASQVSFITNDLCGKLGYKPTTINTSVIGINGNTSILNKTMQIKVSSLQNAFQTTFPCLVIPKITQNLPIRSFDNTLLDIPSNIKLADMNFNKSSPIDILIGATHFYSLMCIGQISIGRNMPVLQKTILGWVISGNLGRKNVKSQLSFCNVALTNEIEEQESNISNKTLYSTLTRFWQIESIQPQNPLSLLSFEEQFCEKHFLETVTRDENGTLVVSIPFNSKLSLLGDSKEHAQDRFYSLEKKFAKNPLFYKEYSKFMHEYIQLGHATKITSNVAGLEDAPVYTITTLDRKMPINDIPNFYLPHHAVFKGNSLTTKIRIVFDGSAKLDSNISINETQIVGPVLQDDLFSILLRFRQGRIALTADCEKMYRMIKVHPSLRKFQCILWRDNSEQTLDTYHLNTVTYGTASASYLATKCLEYLADQNKHRFPKRTNVIKTSFYMDDLLFTCDTVEEVLQIKNEIIEILNTANIPIRKFLSNSPTVMNDTGDSKTTFFTVPLGERSNAKALGLFWNSVSDYIYYNVQLHNNGPSITKRSILSMISQFFDPLGLLSPILITGKIIIQKLWQLKLSWDESVPCSIQSQWINFKSQLLNINLLQSPRCVTLSPKCTIQLHGFCNSSSVAYGACIYVRCTNFSNQVSTHLLCSKSRVAPLHTITIPRLELCAAVLLVQLMHKVRNALTIDCSSVFLWSDSTIVLNWIQSAPNKYKTFIANRIAAIQEFFPGDHWRHVTSEDNPSDIISRGISTAEMLTNSQWWTGPNFLSDTKESWKRDYLTTASTEVLELKATTLTVTHHELLQNDLYKKFSSFGKLQRVVAYMLRFISNCKGPSHLRNLGTLTVTELQQSSNLLIRACQQSCYFKEIQALMGKNPLKSTSNILSLNPFLDENHILRVGGRIAKSRFEYEKKHPVLLPKGHPLTELLFQRFHKDLLHCGVQQLLACMREQYWPISGKTIAKKIIRNCIQCFRAKPIYYNPLMGNLPSKRLEPNQPAFYNTGLDYAGPILLRDRKLRGAKLIKAYICIFVCLVTRAVHLEVVTDLSTNSFIAVLKRFVARRGKPFTISSDNAKNFVGARNQLQDLYKFLQNPSTQNKISDHLHVQSIKWEFITPHAPHQGGIWEGGVKSTKLHLTRVLGNTNLTYEGFCTVLNQIECVLNSRPLSCLSTDPLDLNPLTPGHFLIGKPLCAIPEPNYLTTKQNRLSIYQRNQQLVQHFWRRWSREVVPELQQRTKWYKNLPNLIQIGTLVLIREDNLLPLNWLLGRVTEIHQAADGVIRSCAVKTPSGNIIKRPVNKLCALPV